MSDKKSPTLSELKQLLAKVHLEPIRQNGEHIVDPTKMVKSHISYLEQNASNRAYLPYYNRINKLYEIFKNKRERED